MGVFLLGAACGGPGETEQPLALGEARQAFVNGTDDRREYFDLEEGTERAALERFTVALMPNWASEVVLSRDMTSLPTWGELDDLCPEEPFVDQPSAAFCSGVLVDWDLVLTSGHCIAAVPLSELRVVFGYYYAAPGELAVSPDDVYGVETVVTSRRDSSGAEERLDFGWLHLSERVRLPREPASVHTGPEAVVPGAPVISIGAGGGVPIKLDAGGKVQETRLEFDYFVADTDTSEGSSGGGIFDANLAVLGTLARGAPDFQLGTNGCRTTASQPDPTAALEEFTYAHRAVAALCEVEPDRHLCSKDCGAPCAPLPRPLEVIDDDGCSLAPPQSGQLRRAGALLLLGALLASRRRAAARAR